MAPQLPLRVMFFITGLSTGGAETMLLKLLSALPRSEFLPVVVSLLDRGTIGPRIEALGVPVYSLELRRPWRAPRGLLSLRALCRQTDPDLLVGWMYHGNLLATLVQATMARRAAVVWSIRQSLYGLTLERRLTALLIRAGGWLSRRPAAVIYNSTRAAAQHRIAGYRSRRDIVIPNGFDCEAYRPRAEERVRLRERIGAGPDSHVVGLIARVHPMKGHGLFLEAAAHLVASGLDVHFICAGRGADTGNAELTAAIGKLGLKDRVHLLGEERDVARLMAGLDLLCSASTSGEGFPNVIGEAMACGVPCAVTDVGDSASVVGETGAVVPPGNAVALAQACGRLLRESGDAKTRRSAAARNRTMEQYSLSRSAGRYAELFHEITGIPARSRA
jgi:glycosyltransferase involved in cell wall biosynthesis